MKKVALIVVYVLLIIAIGISGFFAYSNYNRYIKEKNNGTKIVNESDALVKRQQDTMEEILAKKEELEGLKTVKKDKIERLQEWKDLNQKVKDSLS